VGAHETKQKLYAPYSHVLIHIRTTTDKQLASPNNMQKPLKPTCIASNYCSQTRRAADDNSPRSAPALRRHVSHAHTQLRLARHARTNRRRSRNQNRFPCPEGWTSRTSSHKPPMYLVLQYMNICIYIYIYIYIYICLPASFEIVMFRKKVAKSINHYEASIPYDASNP